MNHVNLPLFKFCQPVFKCVGECWFKLCLNALILAHPSPLYRILLSKFNKPPPSKLTQLEIEPQRRDFAIETSYGAHSTRLSRKFHFGIKFLKKNDFFAFWWLVSTFTKGRDRGKIVFFSFFCCIWYFLSSLKLRRKFYFIPNAKHGQFLKKWAPQELHATKTRFCGSTGTFSIFFIFSKFRQNEENLGNLEKWKKSKMFQLIHRSEFLSHGAPLVLIFQKLPMLCVWNKIKLPT